ncbi:MAG: hypothetical protein GYA21_19525 [Myxococcales bacterium]|nr:hypothetical protein [Myxococcales bacterium]
MSRRAMVLAAFLLWGCGPALPERPVEPLRVVLEDVRIQRSRGTEVFFRGRADRAEMALDGQGIAFSGGIRAWFSGALWRERP